MKLVPLSDRVVLKQLEAEETTKSGIILTSSAQEKPQEAEVIAVGPGGMVDGKEVKMQVTVGQKVIYSKYAGTEVAAGGTNLSGGQRQRISIARAFMKEAPIVLMDEPSSALDTYSENAVLEAMSVFMKKKTVIMVSHRMTGAEKFNRVVRMD